MGAGVVDEVIAAVGAAPDEDPGEGLGDLPSAVGLDAVVGPGQRAEVVDPGLAGWSAVVGGDVGGGVVEVAGAAGGGGVGEAVHGGA